MANHLEADLSPSVLIADDDPAVVSFLGSRCQKAGFRVSTACDGMEMLTKARQIHPDVLIVDVNMPELDGISASCRLLDPSSRPVEVIVVTGSSSRETVERCESLGMFYSRKGPDLWKQIADALIEIYPSMSRAKL